MFRLLRTRLRPLLRRDRHERELDAELRFHLEMLTEQNVRAGMSRDEAWRAALRTFGPVDLVKDQVRDTWLSRMTEAVAQDLRYGARGIRKSPGFAGVVMLTMALGIGANTAVFSVVNGVLLRPLPYADGQELVVLQQQASRLDVDDMGFSYKEILDYRTRSRSLEDVVEFHSMWFILLGRREPERLSTGVVSARFFDVLGVQALHGRTFVEGDDAHGADAVLVLSHRYWTRAFGTDPSVVGRVFQMNDRPHQVIGVLPPIPQYPLEVDVYMPTSACPFRSDPQTIGSRNARMMTAFARLRDGVSLDKADSDLAIVAASLQKDYPGAYPPSIGYGARAVALRDELTREFGTTLTVLLGTAGFVLLIVCASVANLMLARHARRQQEFSVRSVLGAGRARLARQLLTESALLSVLGGLAGLAVARFGMQMLVAFAERFTTRAAEIQIDTTVLLYTLAVSAATGLVFGAFPALAARGDQAGNLKDGARIIQSRPGVRHTLIVVQIAASFMLLIGAGLTVRSLIKLHQVDPGFRTDSILTMRIDLNFTKYPPGTRAAFWQQLEERLRHEPGVITVGAGATFPLNDRGPFSQPVQIEGRRFSADLERPLVDARLATPDYFATIGQRLLSGRTFNRSDRSFYGPAGADPVEEFAVIVNQTMARHYWPHEDPVGRRLSTANSRAWAKVVGVVADTRQQLDEPSRDEIYVPLLTGQQLSTTWLVRSAVDPGVMERQIRAVVRDVDPDQPVDNFRTLAEVRSESLEQRRLTAMLLGLFGLLALVITATGIAGVVAFSVNQRTREFGVRMALGARRGEVLRMVLGQGLQLVLVGLAIGLAGALVLTRLLSTLLFGVEPTDAVTFAAVSMVLVAAAALACVVPARRAASVDPLVALRAS
ncbi:MAG TPA: ABC transporter permease [Vicinamibacterales bacterium]|nr:ABC transporter permease [Vicinamibacterales bacterium]